MKHSSFFPCSKPQSGIRWHARPHREFPAAMVTSLALLLGSTHALPDPVTEPCSEAAAEAVPEPPLKPDITALLSQLQSDDLETRYDAMRQLGTAVDPRIPDACLSVLTKEGNSIRRLAARAIGSHWQQIPKERVPVFTAALTAQLDSEHDGLRNMARRGIALITRSYDDAMVSRSSNQHWVIYERHGLPCLIDTRNETEELLGFGTEAKFRPAYSNKEVAPWAVWHPSKERVALEIIEHRHHTTIWVWEHKKGLRQFRCEDSAKALGINEGAEFGIHFASAIVGWTADGLEFAVTLSVKQGENYIDYDNKRILWNPERDRFSALPDEPRREPADGDAGGKPSPQEVQRHETETNTRYIGSSADWLKLRRDLEGDSENSFERARHLEARQLATKPAGVRRDGPALILKALNETEVRLVDQNADNSDATAFSYYDTVPALDAHIVHIQYWEGDAWLLVSRKTGAKTQLSELPVVSPDKRWFATASYDFAYNPNELVIWSVRKDGSFEREFQVEPGRWGPTFLRWLSPTRLRVRCESPQPDWSTPDPKPVVRTFEFVNGKWRQTGDPEPWKE